MHLPWTPAFARVTIKGLIKRGNLPGILPPQSTAAIDAAGSLAYNRASLGAAAAPLIVFI